MTGRNLVFWKRGHFYYERWSHVEVRLYIIILRNPNSPSPLETTWPQYTADREEFIGLSPNFTVRSKMRPEKMALWNEILPSLVTVEPSTASHKPTTTDASASKGMYFQYDN